MSTEHADDIRLGKRFEFGANWQRFLNVLDEQRIAEAVVSLRQMLGIDDLRGKSFLDGGSGSGLFSLAARRLGARVHSFDYDPNSVACTRELKRRYFDGDADWVVDEASVLDEAYVRALGAFDVVYSWGVLHHTGELAKALANIAIPVKPGGLLFIAIYNDQDEVSHFWHVVKRAYCAGGAARAAVLGAFVPYFAAQSALQGLVKYRNPLGHMQAYKNKRGMSLYHDWIDWLGGYPFEVARPEKIFQTFRDEGFELVNLTTTNRLGCNQFVFRRA